MTVKTWRTWTTKELRALAEMRGDGMTAPEIARALGRSLASVRCRLVSERLHCSRSALLHRWLHAFRRPHTIRGLAEEFGVSAWAVKRAKNRLRRAGHLVPAAEKGGGACAAARPT
ncbi:MAG: hypothetical protein IT429_22695 [Gemmataceae bacterium]|nr:hypothetical protein [Gemmataceae bacterium]